MSETTELGSSLPPVRKIPPGAPIGWLVAGWRDFSAAPLPSLFYGVLFALMGWAIVCVFRNAYQYVWGLTTGFLLVGPFLATGLYDLSRRRERGLPATLGLSLVAWRPNLGSIGVFALVLGIVLLLWSRASLVVIAVMFPAEMPTLQGFMANLSSAGHLEFLFTYFLVGGFFATCVFVISVVSVPMMLDRNTDGIVAALTSVRASLENLPAMIAWGLIIALVIGAGFLTLLVGLVVAVPVIGHATWHAYRAIIQ